MKYERQHKNDYIQDICNGVENGGEITIKHETKLIDVSEQHSIGNVLFDDRVDVSTL